MRVLCIGLAAIVLVGCGSEERRSSPDGTPTAGPTEAPSRASYESKIRKLTKAWDRQATELILPPRPNASLSYSRSYLAGVEGLLKTIAIDLRDVTPPREVRSAHADWTRANELRARTVRRAITAIDRRDKRTARRIMSRRSLVRSETFRLLRRAHSVFEREGYQLGKGPSDPSSVLA